MVAASRYAVTTHERCESPPRSPTIVGSAVETIVWSSAASSSTKSSAVKIRRTRGWSFVTAGQYHTRRNYFVVQSLLPMTGAPEDELLLRELGHLIRQLTRLVGGADDGPPMTATQRIALVELGDEGPLRLNDLAR